MHVGRFSTCVLGVVAGIWLADETVLFHKHLLEISRRRFGLEKPEVQLFDAFGLVVSNGVMRIDGLHRRTLRTGPTDTLARVLFRQSARSFSGLEVTHAHRAGTWDRLYSVVVVRTHAARRDRCKYS